MRFPRLVLLVTLPFILAACRHYGPLYEYNGPGASVSTGALVVIGIREAAPTKLPADHFFVVYVRSYDPDTLTLNRRIPTKNHMSFAGLTEAGLALRGRGYITAGSLPPGDYVIDKIKILAPTKFIGSSPWQPNLQKYYFTPDGMYDFSFDGAPLGPSRYYTFSVKAGEAIYIGTLFIEPGSDKIDVNFQTTSPIGPPWITKVENEFEKARKVFDEIGLGGELVNRPLKASW